MQNDLPNHLRQSLSEADCKLVLRWWAALSPEQRLAVGDVLDRATTDHQPLPSEEDDEEPETEPFYDYLVNHELRWVGYVDEETVGDVHRILSHYVASLGSDLRHGRGTVE